MPSSASPPLLPDASSICNYLGALAPQFNIRVLASCPSTNSALLDNAPAADGRIHVCVTPNQTAGRGRRGRSWQSWPGRSLTFSGLWRFPASSPAPAGLSLVAGIATAQALEELGIAGLQLKWPNDILVSGHKIAGILVELLSGRGNGLAAVVGIGINLDLPPAQTIPHGLQATDLRSHLAPPPDPEEIVARVLERLHTVLAGYERTGFGPLREAWQQRNAFSGLPVRVIGEHSELAGVCAGVDEDGALLLRSDAGLTRVLSGEVSLRVAS